MLKLPTIQVHFMTKDISDEHVLSAVSSGQKYVEWAKEVVAALPTLTVKMRKDFILLYDDVDLVSYVLNCFVCNSRSEESSRAPKPRGRLAVRIRSSDVEGYRSATLSLPRARS